MFYSCFVKNIESYLVKLLATLSFSGLMVLLAYVGSAPAAEGEVSLNKINAINAALSGNDMVIRIQGTMDPAYTVYELFSPSRIVLDIQDAEIAPAVSFIPPENLPISLATQTIQDSSSNLARLEFTLPATLPYNVVTEKNDIIVSIEGVRQDAPPAAEKEPVETQETQAPTAPGVATVLSDININTSPFETRVSIIGNGPIMTKQYSFNVLDGTDQAPPRLYVDIYNVSGDELLNEQKVGGSVARVRVARHESKVRIVLDAAGKVIFPYEIKEISNGLMIAVKEPEGDEDQITSTINEKKLIEQGLPEIDSVNSPTDLLPGLEPQPTERPEAAESSAVQSLEDNFSFAGYQKERITVDFYKIDLHNVFRLIREISGANLVIDSGVSGSLTLSLKDVPWDFALDIILNLNNLQKEERMNTIIILPKNKRFEWPERADENLSFDAVEEVVSQDAIVIQQQHSMSPGVTEAKSLIGEGKKLEDDDNFAAAVEKYKAALHKWPENKRLPAIISSIYLVELRQNAKAVFYAKKALEANPDNRHAALNAAIALANMRKFREAQGYFDQAVSGRNPSREALLSYAVFSEEQRLYSAALKLLAKHDQLYGENLDSMLAQARIFDKKGETDTATEKYTSILLSGFHLPPDLRKYINGRIAYSQSN